MRKSLKIKADSKPELREIADGAAYKIAPYACPDNPEIGLEPLEDADGKKPCEADPPPMADGWSECVGCWRHALYRALRIDADRKKGDAGDAAQNKG